MGNYTKIVDYAAKDLLLTGDPAKAGKGAEIGAEFDAIAAMSATKAELAGSASQAFSASLLKVGTEAAAAWPSTWRMIDIGTESAIGQDAAGQTVVLNNAYTTDGTNFLYRGVGAASRTRYMADGSQEFATAPSAGGAGTAATFTVQHSVSNAGVAKFGPEAAAVWASTWRVIELGARSSLISDSPNTRIYHNVNYDGADKLRAAAPGSRLFFDGATGGVQIDTAPSGAAGSVAAFTTRLRVAPDGTVTFGANTALHTGTVFHGRVNGDGTAARLPAGWTSVRNSIGSYTVTHGLGTANWGVVLTSRVSANAILGTDVENTTSFRAIHTDSAGTLTDGPFCFILMLD